MRNSIINKISLYYLFLLVRATDQIAGYSQDMMPYVTKHNFITIIIIISNRTTVDCAAAASP